MSPPEPLRTYVTFLNDLERVENADGKPLPAMPDPPGRILAERIVTGLNRRDLDARPERPFEDYCRMIEGASGQTGFEIRVGYIGDNPQQWLVMIDSTLSFIGRLLGKKDALDMRRVTLAVDGILREESCCCSGIRWYTLKEWDAGGRQWARHPTESHSLSNATDPPSS